MNIDKKYESALSAGEGWIEWAGGECPPVTHGTMVDVKLRDGSVFFNKQCWGPGYSKIPGFKVDNTSEAGGAFWRSESSQRDIIAYRLHKPDINSRANDDRLEQDLNDCIGQGVDVVNHPSHYTKGNIECIDAIDSATTGKSGIEAVCVANVIKYLWRYEEKNGLEDVKKAQWYLNKLISELESR